MVWLGIVEEDVISADVDKRPLRDIRVALVIDDRGQVGFSPEGSESGFLEPLPEMQKVGEANLTGMDFELELAKGQWAALVFLEEGIEHVKFGAFDIELEDVNKLVSVELHETLE